MNKVAQVLDCKHNKPILNHSVTRQRDTFIDSVSEVASAKGDYKIRPVLNDLLKRCRREKCALIVSKLDRLSRDVESIANLVNGKSIRFIVVQLGFEAENFQIHLFASLAQKERDWIWWTNHLLLFQKLKPYVFSCLNYLVANLALSLAFNSSASSVLHSLTRPESASSIPAVTFSYISFLKASPMLSNV